MNRKIFLSMTSGVLVGTFTAGTHWFIVPHEPSLVTHIFMADLIGALSTTIMCLAILLRHERVDSIRTLSCVTIVSGLNHRIRNSAFPLCLAVQRIGDKEASQAVDQAVERINIALREAIADAISGRARNVQD